MSDATKCAACKKPTTGKYSIHRDGYYKGPEVPLCDACGSSDQPTCEQLFAMIAARLAVTCSCGGTIYHLGDSKCRDCCEQECP